MTSDARRKAYTRPRRCENLIISFVLVCVAQCFRSSNNQHWQRLLTASSFQQYLPLDSQLIHLLSPEPYPQIQRNPSATLATDITLIHHEAETSRVVVTFQANARCPRPYLRGRLSGPALVNLDWEWHKRIGSSDKETTTRMEGSYQVPVPGHYFLEVIAIYCDNFFHDLGSDHEVHSAEDWMANETIQKTLHYSFGGVCMEDAANQQLTADNATIWVENATPKDNQPGGFWMNSEVDQHSNSSAMIPVYARYQTPNCFEETVREVNLCPHIANEL